MDLGVVEAGDDVAEDLAGLDFVAGFYGHGAELAVESEVLAVLHQHALVVAGNNDYLLYYGISPHSADEAR